MRYPEAITELGFNTTFMKKSSICHFCLKSWFITFWAELETLFLFYLTECLACRQTECWIKTFNSLGQNLPRLIRDRAHLDPSVITGTRWASVHHVHCHTPGCPTLVGRRLPGHTWTAIGHKFEDLSTEALALTGNCLASSSFICSQDDFKWILLTNVSLYANGSKEKWRTQHK